VVETRFERGRWKRHYFVDGGYMDNSGALSAIQSLDALRKAARGKVQVNVIVLHLYALSVPEEEAYKKQTGQRATKQNEFASIPSAVLKARGAASRSPIRLLCNSLLDYSNADLGAGQCDEIFERRIITPDDSRRFTNESYCTSSKRASVIGGLRYPVDYARNLGIELNDANSVPIPIGDADPIQAATWIPVPLEVARSDRQKNAITALLGWSLLEGTTNNMNEVMEGTAHITLADLAQSVSDMPSGIDRVWEETVSIPECSRLN